MKPDKVSDMIEHRYTEPDRWGITIPYDSIKKEFKNTFWLEFFRLRREGKATLDDVPEFNAASIETNIRKLRGKPPKQNRQTWINTTDHHSERRYSHE